MDWPSSQKESQKWFKGLAAVNQQAQTSPKRWVVTCDRESDIFEFFKAPRKASVDLLVDSLRQATLALTKLVGFTPSRKQPLPGSQSSGYRD